MWTSVSGCPAAWSAPWGDAPLFENSFTQQKGRPVSRLPLGALLDSAGSTGPGGLHLVHRLLGRGFRHREYRYESAAAGFCTKLDMAFDLGEQGMVGAHADIKAG